MLKMYRSIQILLFLVVFVLCKTQEDDTIIKVAIYYESLCPDSKRFIIGQLYPSYGLLKNDLDLHLIPFGKAQATNTTGEWEFECQHGPKECHGNVVQACVLNSTDTLSALEFINCAMSSIDASDDIILEGCANDLALSWDSIQNCVIDGSGDELLAKNGVITNNLEPPLSYVPTIVFNDVYDQQIQEQAEFNFLATVCTFLDFQNPICGK